MPNSTAIGPEMHLKTVLGDEALRLRSLTASEELGRLFEFDVVALSDADAAIEPAQLLGTNAQVSVAIGSGETRYFNGIVARAGLQGAQGKLIAWRLHLRPWLWLLTRRSDCRIFQNQTVEAILKRVFEPYTPNLRFALSGTYVARPYCVQYRETDFAFVSRLMEEEGMYYFHEHSDGAHKLVICDAKTAHDEYPSYGSVKFRESQDQLLDLEAITDWGHAYELRTGKVTHTDYDFVKPSTSLKQEKTSVHPTSKPAYEHYDYPGLYTEAARGGALAQVRIEEFDAGVLRIDGSTTTVGGLVVGYRFALVDHPLGSENTDHVVVASRIHLQHAGYESGQGDNRFECQFAAIRYADVFRPERTTPRPLISGPQTAVVVGPSGEEIHTDEHGRVKVQFHWDRLGKKDENSSCWLRVSSHWAGKGWGMISIPRIGQEVVVDFLEGDPDQPLVTGRVYNAEQVAPYKLPDHKTITTIKSRSSKGGGADNFNELAFDDLSGSEWVRLHAEKDLFEVVKNDAHREVGNDQFLKVSKNLTEEIGENVDRKIKGKFTELIEKTAELEIKQDTKVKIGAKLGLKSGADLSVETGAALSVKSGAAGDVKIGANLGVEAVNVHVKGSANVVVEAGAMLTLKGAMINIEASGIVSINGSLVKINSGGGGGSGGGANPTAPEAPQPPKEIQPSTDAIKKVKDDHPNR